MRAYSSELRRVVYLDMGSCSSVHKEPDSPMKVSVGMGSKAKTLFVPSPAKMKPLNGEDPVKPVGSGFGLKSPDFGSKEEIFFDSRAWLDSDCEDDFFSINGEFTPSRGSTPNNQTSTVTTPTFNKLFAVDKLPDSKSEPSPTCRKNLAMLFQETSQEEQELTEQQQNAFSQIPKSLNRSPTSSGANSVGSKELSPSRDFKNRKKASQCCLPILLPTFSGFTERRQKMSPVDCSA